MSLAQFQRALTDLTASPALCRAVRRDPALLAQLYALTPLELGRLADIAASNGMEANCMIYRANRLAPVALNCPELCAALGDDLNRLISAYWYAVPTTDVHFLVEAERFCQFLAERDDLPVHAREALRSEHAKVRDRLAATAALAHRDAIATARFSSPA